MRVMWTNKESLMAVLEAFVHDPLLNWRRLGVAAPSDEETDESEAEAELGHQSFKEANHLFVC